MTGLYEGGNETPDSLKAILSDMGPKGLEWNGIFGRGHCGPALRPFTMHCANPEARRIPKPTPADYTKVRCVPRFRARNPPSSLDKSPPCVDDGDRGILWNDDEMEKC
ncbi:hypothetical protein ANN_26136 [Periplaneta americana]|uniref:Uncharacterized protein n=1 Tax=Periplaneta americana TaxID=6978 RepID=A0ABQ8S5W1_PERAM|nr:hypothetical protein ANN_26136 [Periplaneta americana]